MTKKEAQRNVSHWLSKFGIQDWRSKRVESLSKGMAQKVQFIVTVLHEPKLLIFDEPFSGFDPINAQLIAQEILQLRDKGATIIFSTHRMESVEEMCDEIALIDKSNKILDGKLNDIKRQFKTHTFQVGLNTLNPKEVKASLKQNFDVLPADFKLLGNELTLNVKLGNNNSANELLSFLTSRGEVQHFVELIPNANDIFIQAINKNN